MARAEVTGRKIGVPKNRKQPAKPSPYDVQPIDPYRFYRKSEMIQRRFYGYGATQFDEKVKAGEIVLTSLSDTGRGVGAFGSTILEWQASRVVKRVREMA